MEHLINKDALVAEIEKNIMQYEVAFDNSSFANYEASLIAKGKYRKLKDILSFLDTLEVKEVDLVNGNIDKMKQEEPVSEDLEEAGKEWLRPQLDKSYEKYGENKMMELTHFDGYAMLEAIEFGANWKEEQFEKNRLKHCNSITNEQAELEQGFIDQHLDKHDRMPTFLDAIEYGMRLQKEQTMKNAVECEYFDGSLFRNDLREKYRDCDKVKIIIVKSE